MRRIKPKDARADAVIPIIIFSADFRGIFKIWIKHAIIGLAPIIFGEKDCRAKRGNPTIKRSKS